jgi:hypothetical protein
MSEFVKDVGEQGVITYCTDEPIPKTLCTIDINRKNPVFIFNPKHNPEVHINKALFHPDSVPAWKRPNTFEDLYYKAYALQILGLTLDPYPEDSPIKSLNLALHQKYRDSILGPISSMTDFSYISIKILHFSLGLTRINQGYCDIDSFEFENLGLIDLEKQWIHIDKLESGIREKIDYYLLVNLKGANTGKNYSLIISSTKPNGKAELPIELSKIAKRIAKLLN